MRTRFWLFGAAFVAICVLLVMLRTKKSEQLTLPEGPVAATNLPTGQKPPTVVENWQNTNPSRPMELPPTATPLAQSVAQTNPGAAQLLAAWQGRIEFYGKVVDESSNAVPGAQVGFRWVEVPDETGNRTASAESDANGLFALHNQRGLSLGVSVSKEGYHPSRRDTDTFNYGPLRGEPFPADPQNPVIFHLLKKKKGELLVEKDIPPGAQIAQLRRDGTPVEIDLLNGEKAAPGNGQLKLEFWRNLSEQNASKFDWKLQLSVAGGGLIPTGEEFALQAPETDYKPTVTVDMPKTNQGWLGELRNKYYVRLPDRAYGRIDLYLLPYNGVFTIHSVINPSGSRNLEPAN